MVDPTQFSSRRRAVVCVLAASIAATVVARAARADEQWPAHAVRIVVPFSAGSSSDTVARLFAERLSTRLKQPFVIENRAGAGGVSGTDAVAKAPADGYTLLVTTSSPLVINPAFDRNVHYDALKSFSPIAVVSVLPLLLVTRPDFPAKTLPELMTYARQHPGALNFGSNGIGSYSHLSMELLGQSIGAKLTHVPYRGPAQAETDLLSGAVQVSFDSVITAAQLVKSGRLRTFGVSSANVDPIVPQAEPLASQGVPELSSFDVVAWTGLLAPANTPKAVIDALTSVVREALDDSAFRKALLARNIEPVPAAQSGDMSARITKESARWAALIKSANLQLD